jgi:hypothetical protein
VPGTAFITLFDELFAGRRDVYSVGHPHRTPAKRALGKLEYFTATEPLTPDVLAKHVEGSKLVGVYPLVDSKVKFFAIDFDAPKGPDGLIVPDPFPIAWGEAEAQAQRLEDAGMQVYLERSRSGNGVHLWGFLDDWTDGALVRAAVRPYLLKASSLDRMYPVQPTADVLKGGLGNLIALPFYGAVTSQGFSSFLNRDTMEVIDPEHFMGSVRRNYRAAVERIVEEAPKEYPVVALAGSGTADYDPDFSGRPPRPLRGWLKVQSQYGCSFINHCYENRRSLPEPMWYMAVQQATCFEHGREIAHAFSRDDPRYDPNETNEKFNHAMENPPMGCAKIHEQYPELACKGCPLTAPYHIAKKSILDLVQTADGGMEQGGYREFYEDALHYDSGDRPIGHKLGLPGLDNMYTVRRGEYTLVAARPSMGKTAFMVDVSQRLGERGVHVFRFSAEAARPMVMSADLGREAEVNTEALRGERRDGGVKQPLTRDEKQRLNDAIKVLNERPVYTNYTALDPERIIEIVEAEMLRRGVPLDAHIVVMFDYVQFGVKEAGETNYERVSRLSTQFKYIAKILNCSVIAFAQLRRDAEGEEPTLADLKESGQLEQDADAVILLHGERDGKIDSPRTFMLEKQRVGQTGRCEFIFRKAISRFDVAYAPLPEARGDVLAGEPFTLELVREDSE